MFPLDGSKKLRIFCSVFDPAVGGPTIRARTVYERMLAAGHEVLVGFPRGVGDAFDYMRAGGIEVVRLAIDKPVPPRRLWAFLRFVVTTPLAILRVHSFLTDVRPDIVHVNGAYDVVPAIAARLARIPVVWHLNDTIFPERMSRLLGRFVLIMASSVVVAARRVGRHYGIPDHLCTVLYAPVSVDRFAARDPRQLPAGIVKLGLVANWNWIKGHDRLLELVRLLHQRGVPTESRLVGKFLERQKTYWEPLLERVEELRALSKIETPGFSDDVPSEIAGRDIMLLTSRSEACPLTVLEAMSIGVPQVVFDVGGVRELLGEGDEAAGFVVGEGDVAAMADAIQDILNDHHLYQRMALNGQARARRYFDLERCVAGHVKVYRDALNLSE